MQEPKTHQESVEEEGMTQRSYEPVALMQPQAESQRPIILIGPPGVQSFRLTFNSTY